MQDNVLYLMFNSRKQISRIVDLRYAFKSLAWRMGLAGYLAYTPYGICYDYFVKYIPMLFLNKKKLAKNLNNTYSNKTLLNLTYIAGPI